jgi:hypothetical protein
MMVLINDNKWKQMMNKTEIQTLALKITLIFSFLTGVFLTMYNLFSFKVAKNGYYFNDENQTWLAVGACSIALAYVIKNWHKI